MIKILLVGAIGYIGGTIQSQLQTSTQASLQPLTFDLLARCEHQEQALVTLLILRYAVQHGNGSKLNEKANLD